MQHVIKTRISDGDLRERLLAVHSCLDAFVAYWFRKSDAKPINDGLIALHHGFYQDLISYMCTKADMKILQEYDEGRLADVLVLPVPATPFMTQAREECLKAWKGLRGSA